MLFLIVVAVFCKRMPSDSAEYIAAQERLNRDVLVHNAKLADQRSADLKRIAEALENLKK